jgi:phage terminase small subunit
MNERQTKFCQFYAKSGNATQAYREAGYKSKNPKADEANASRLIRNDKVALYLKELSQKSESKAIASIQEIKEFWTKVLQSDEEEMPHRLKASELMVKVEGGFIDKVEHSGAIVKRIININPTSKDK